jgi:vancomycin aglycone glucosyltransferase
VSRGWADLSVVDNDPDRSPSARRTSGPVQAGHAVVHRRRGHPTSAALAGTPQVIVPQIYDQHCWARRIRDLGIEPLPARRAHDRLADARSSALLPVCRPAPDRATAVRRDGAHIAAERLMAVGSGA